ncbi:type IV secretion system protein, partial [Rickettsia endosymbiont of Cardiosporidium cionae]|uniref:type IV secretion system protein n=1 Tax=Rickettsia endosymbiont of Cardiosporidium cionae TaxID=2777155 RepID=UPI001892F59F
DCAKNEGSCWKRDEHTKNFVKCRADNECWNIDGRGLKVAQGGKEEFTGQSWNKRIVNEGILKLKIQDPIIVSLKGEARKRDLRRDTSEEKNQRLGGYEVFVRAEPFIVKSSDNNNHLKACVASEGSNPNLGNACQEFNISKHEELSMPISGNIWFKIDDSGDYKDNYGEYTVSVTRVIDRLIFSKIIGDIINVAQNTMHQAGRKIFHNITCDNIATKNCINYLVSLQLLLTLYITIYSIMYIFGLVKMAHGDLIIMILKVSIIIILIRKNSWEFFNNYIFNTIINGSTELITKIQSNIDATNPFAFLDMTIGMTLLNPINLLKLLTLLYSGITGIIYLCIIIYGLYMFFKAIFNALISYFVSFVFIAILIAIAPIFIPFMLFN